MKLKRIAAAAGALVVAAAAGSLLVSRATEAADPVTVLTSDFENGTVQGWAPRSGETVAVSTAAAHGGTSSLLVSGRTANWNGPSRDLLTTVQAGTRYTYSVWVRMAVGAGGAQLRMSVERRWQGAANYEQVAGNTNVTEGAWTQLTGTYTLANSADFFVVYVESASGTASFHVDDFSMSYVPLPPIQTGIPSLKSVFAADFPLGAAISRPQILGQHAQLLSKHFNTVTPGNALKWDATEPTDNTFVYTDADAMVNFAKANNLGIRGHTFVWHQQTPTWVFNDANGQPMTPTEANKALLLSRLEDHIRNVGGRYANDIGAWDVVNEVIDENQADGLRRSSWYTITGLDFIRTAFRVARAVAPNAKLYINDYNTNVPAKRDKLFNLVQQLRAEGVPIDGVGHQMHVNVDWPTAAETAAMLQKFVPLGVQQQITEMDVSIYTNSGESFPTPPAERLTRQANKYKALFDVYRQFKANLTNVTLWGLADDDTWLDTFPVTRKDAPLLFDTQLQAKEAYWALVGQPTPTPSVSPSASPSPTPSPTPSPPPSAGGACRVTYATNTWTSGSGQGGFTASVTIANTGPAAINGWTLRFAFAAGQTDVRGWSATWAQSGANVSATNLSWNAAIPPGGQVQIGFNAAWTGSNPPPNSFTLNNLACLTG